MLLDFRYRLVGEDDLVPDAASPLRHDCLPCEGFHAGILLFVMGQIEIAHGDVQSIVESQFIVRNRPRETHRTSLRNSCRKHRTHTGQNRSASLIVGGNNATPSPGRLELAMPVSSHKTVSRRDPPNGRMAGGLAFGTDPNAALRGRTRTPAVRAGPATPTVAASFGWPSTVWPCAPDSFS